MPKQKDFKRRVRGRMQKTGESYTSARAQLVRRKPPSSIDYSKLAGMSDTAVRAKTGRTWSEWVEALDAIGASRLPHREIATRVHSEFGIGDWWGQAVTVGYERIRGLRVIGQRRDGSYEANKSKTFDVPLDTLFGAFATKRLREQWLGGARPTIRKADPGKSVRMTWEDGTPVEVYFTGKTASKSQVAIAHRKLASKADAEKRKAEWAESFSRLADLLRGAKG